LFITNSLSYFKSLKHQHELILEESHLYFLDQIVMSILIMIPWHILEKIPHPEIVAQKEKGAAPLVKRNYGPG